MLTHFERVALMILKLESTTSKCDRYSPDIRAKLVITSTRFKTHLRNSCIGKKARRRKCDFIFQISGETQNRSATIVSVILTRFREPDAEQRLMPAAHPRRNPPQGPVHLSFCAACRVDSPPQWYGGNLQTPTLSSIRTVI